MLAEWSNGDLILAPESGEERAALLLLWETTAKVVPVKQEAPPVLRSGVLQELVHGFSADHQVEPRR